MEKSELLVWNEKWSACYMFSNLSIHLNLSLWTFQFCITLFSLFASIVLLCQVDGAITMKHGS